MYTTFITKLQHYLNSPIHSNMLRKLITPIALLLCIASPASAADYVFMYNNHYLAVDNSGNIDYADTFSPQCVWTCVSSTINLTAATLSNSDDYYLYTEVSGTKYWLVDAESNGGEISVSNNANSASGWRNDNNRLYTYTSNNGRTFYLYYRGNAWRTSRSTGNQNTNYAVTSWGTITTDYRSTTYQVTTNTVNATATVSAPSISPASAELDINDSQTFTASAIATTTPAYTTYAFNSTTHYYFNGTDYTSEANMKASAAWTTATSAPAITYSWTLSGSANSNLSPTSGTGSTITITHSNQAAADASSTLSVTASVTANGASDSKTSIGNATVTALAPKTDPTSLTISSGSPMTVYVGGTGNITYTLTPSPCYNNVTFTSSSTGVATVSNSGVVTGVSTGTATITVTAKKIDGTTNSDLTQTVTVTVKDKVATPVITFTPNPNDNTKATATITCTTSGTTIYYKVNSDDYTVFSNNFNVNENDIVYAYAVMTSNPGNLWDNSDVTTNKYVSCTSDAPTISYVQNGSTATVTITAEAGATIYYTTNGNNPTTSSANGISPLTINNVGNCTFKAIAKNGTCRESDVVTKEIITSGVSGGTVTLYDLEDHNWTYYSDKPDGDYPDNLRSPDPRNVVITYRGGSVANASAVAVSATEPENEYTYYKTIEKKAWGQSEGRWLTGDYAYRTIPNPFLKRPRTNGTTGTNGFWGFAGWKVVSGGEYISEYNNNATIPADALIHFVGLPAGNAGNGAVVLEAQWTQATVTTVNGNVTGNPNNAFTGGTSNTNFIVVSGDDRTVTGMTCDVTVMGCYPDGTGATGARLSTVTGSANDLVIENINLGTGGNDFTANTGWLVVGRGCTGNVRRVHGNTGQIRIRIESGLYNFINPMDGGAANNANYGRIIFGNDYDRATNDGLTSNDQYADNSSHRKLRVINYVSFNGSGAAKGSNTDQSEWMDITIKSGYYGFSADYSLYSTTAADNADGFGLGIGGNSDAYNDTYTVPDINGDGCSYTNLNAGVNNTSYRWQRLMSFYCGRTRGGNYGGVNRVLVEGGELNSINGGGYRNNQYNVNNLVTYHFRMKGGWVKGAIYGTASSSMTNATTKQVITGGEINGWVAGACNGTDVSNDDGRNEGDTYIYLGGTAELRSHRRDGVYNNAWGLVGGVEGGNIFASGRGTNATTAQPNRNYCGSSYRTYTVVADQAEVEQNVSGGGYIGVAQNSYIYITGGEIGKAVYGGSQTPTSTNNTWMTQTTDIRMYGGTVKGGIYGGHYQGTGDAGKIHQDVKISLVNGQVGTDMNNIGYVHGGGYGSGTSVGGNVDVTIGDATATESLVVYGDVYGGSALGTVGDAASDHTNVTLNAGTINGSLYGGGLGDASTPANVYGPVAVKVYGGTVNTTSANGSGAVYGCNNINGAPQRAVTVDIYGTDPAPSANTYALDAVYGGGNQADYTYGTPIVTVHNCDNSIAYVYGGGNAADITHDTDVTIYGGNKIGNVFGGGNGTLTAANVSGDTNVKIYGGTILKVFGGSNSRGSIGGTINVTAESQAENSGDTPCTLLVDELYGGGNMAQSNVGNITIGCMNDGDMINYVYGGSNDADITGAITLTMTGGRVDRLFGGNNTGHSISGDIEVNVDWATGASACPDSYLGYVYGAGNKADFAHNTEVNIKNGTVTHDVFGGGLEAAVAGNVAVNVTGGTVLGSLYGGGALADTNTDAGKTTTVTLSGGTVNNVYGGGLGQKDGFDGATSNIPAYVNGDVLVELNGKTGATNDCVVTGNIFGCNNLNGTPKGTVTVHVYKTNGNGTTKVRTASGKLESPTESDHTYELAAVYGGGNMAAYEPTDAANGKTIVIIDGCDETSIEYVYGGGNAASVPATDVTINGTYEIGYVFGGGNGKDALPNGDPNPGADVGFDPNGAEYGSGQTLVNALGGTMHHVFGGSNTEGNIRTSATVNLDEAKDSNDDVICPLKVDEVYGGGNEALMAGGGNIVLGCITYLKEIYGGAKQADIGSSVSLTITSGHFDRVFGGNNLGGCIKGSITVNIEETGCNPITIGELYGCGNKAAYSVYGYETDGTVKTSGDSPYANPTLNIKSFKSIGRVFGGGLGTKAVVVGNPTVNVNEIVGANASAASVYAGTTRTLSDGSTVTLPAHTAGEMGVIGEVFGGGNAAGVIGDTNVNIATKKKISLVSGSDHSDKDVKGANITGNVYGGGNAADVTGKTNVTIGHIGQP